MRGAGVGGGVARQGKGRGPCQLRGSSKPLQALGELAGEG